MSVLRKFVVGEPGDPGYREGYLLLCPGCDEPHQIWTVGNGITWGFNEDEERPTFTPSLLTWMPDPNGGPDISRCHSFIVDGQWQFLSDCTHALAGQTVLIPPFPY